MIPTAHNTVKCRICDAFLGRYHAYVMTPEQTLTQTADTPPCHRDCAIKDAEYASAQTSEVRAVWTTKVLPEIGNDEMTGHVQFRHLELPHSIQWISPDGKPTTYAELEALRGPQKWCRSLHLNHSHLVRPDGTTACSGASNGVKLPYGAAWIPCEAGDYGRKCTRCMGHAEK